MSWCALVRQFALISAVLLLICAVRMISYKDLISDTVMKYSYELGTGRYAMKQAPKGATVTTLDPYKIVNMSSELKTMVEEVRRQQIYTGAADVFINTYMRSGSTFLGRFIGQNPDTFFWYEPLWKKFTWEYTNGSHHICHYSLPVCVRSAENSTNRRTHALTFLRDVFDCNFEKHSKEVAPGLMAITGSLWKPYIQCAKSKPPEDCIYLPINACKTTIRRAIKVLRMDLRSAALLLATNPKLKILQLLRDPRAVMSSHISTSWYTVKDSTTLDKDASVLCSRMRDDLEVGRVLMRLLPNRVRIVQYEDFVDARSKAKALAQFLGQNYTKQLEEFATKITRHRNRKWTKVQKENNLFSYRSKLTWGQIKLVDKHCHDLYSDLGLPSFKNLADYQDMNKTLLDKPLPFAL